jgi:hypothetical protein
MYSAVGRPSIPPELGERLVRQLLDPSQRMILRHSFLRIDRHQHRPLPPLLTAHPPLPPPPRLHIQTNQMRMRFKRLSTAC